VGTRETKGTDERVLAKKGSQRRIWYYYSLRRFCATVFSASSLEFGNKFFSGIPEYILDCEKLALAYIYFIY
jgi:hypothetical protein